MDTAAATSKCRSLHVEGPRDKKHLYVLLSHRILPMDTSIAPTFLPNIPRDNEFQETELIRDLALATAKRREFEGERRSERYQLVDLPDLDIECCAIVALSPCTVVVERV